MRRSLIVLSLFILITGNIQAQRQMEYLDRGVVAVRNAEGNVFISWRWLALEPAEIAFNLYRIVGKRKAEKLNKAVIAKTTHFIDSKADSTQPISYFVKTVIKGKAMIPGNIWKNDKVPRANNDFGKWAKEVADQEGAFFIDLNAIKADKYDQWGEEKVK